MCIVNTHFNFLLCIYDTLYMRCKIMKIIANNYKNNEVFKIIREWTGLTQKELANELGRKSRDGITKIETGENDFYFDTLMQIIKKHNMIMTIEKK